MIWWLAIWPALAGLALWRLAPGRVALGALAGGALGLAVLLAVGLGGASSVMAWSDTLSLRAALPPMAQAVAVTVPAIAIAVVIFAAAHEEDEGLSRLIGLLLTFVGGMELVIIADDLLTLLIGWEVVGATSWALIGHRWRKPAPMASANYAFVMTRTGDLGLFLALFATFAGSGGTSYEELGTLGGGYLSLAVGGLLVAAVSKAGQVPFSPWLFRAMDGPTSVSSLLHSAAMVAAGVYLLARVQPLIGEAPGFAAGAMTFGLVTALLAGWVALGQVHAKKVLAGSTSAQMGLMIATVGAGFPAIAILHLIVHAAAKAALFFAAGIAEERTGSFDLTRMGLGGALPFASVLTWIAALSLAAVPPLAGGWSKEAMITALEHSGPFIGLAAILAGGLAAAYATRFATLAFGFGDAGDGDAEPRGELAALAILSIVTLALSALWLPAVHDRAAGWLGGELPGASPIGVVASLTAVALGALAGLRMARRPADSPAREWLGLPRAIDAAVTRPFRALSKTAAQLDDGVLDLIPRSVAALARRLSRSAGTADDRVIDGLEPDEARGARRWSGAVDGVVAATALLTRIASRGGERISDLIPTGAGRLAGMAGSDLRQMQSGLAHRYYAILVAGLALLILILMVGG